MLTWENTTPVAPALSHSVYRFLAPTALVTTGRDQSPPVVAAPKRSVFGGLGWARLPYRAFNCSGSTA
jgi:hypothetical protein